jgi:6-phosphofructokinase 1
VLISECNKRFVHIPISAAVSRRNHVDWKGALWRDVLENTRQPVSMRHTL